MKVKEKDKRFNKYARAANKIKKDRKVVAGKSSFGQSSNVKEFDRSKAVETCKSLFKEIEVEFWSGTVRNKFWYKMISHYAKG